MIVHYLSEQHAFWIVYGLLGIGVAAIIGCIVEELTQASRKKK